MYEFSIPLRIAVALSFSKNYKHKQLYK